MLNLFQKVPNPVKIVFLLAFVVSGLAIFGKDFIEKTGIFPSSQNKLTEQNNNSNEITVRIQIRNERTKSPIPGVNVEFERLGTPVNEYTDDAGYIDLKIPKTDFVKVYFNRKGFETANYQIDLNIKDRNLVYYLKETSSSVLSTEANKKILSSPETQSPIKTQLDKSSNQVSTVSEKAQGFKFDLQNCTLKNQEIICSLQITSLEEDSPLRMYGTYNSTPTNITRIIDKSGNEYNANLAKIGTSENSNYAESTIVKDTPINASINFGKPSSEANEIQLLELKFYKESSSSLFKIQFHNIPLLKSS